MATIENLIHNLPDLSKLNFRYAPIVSRLLPGVLMVILVFLIAYRLAGFTVLIFQQDADTTPVHTGTQGVTQASRSADAKAKTEEQFSQISSLHLFGEASVQSNVVKAPIDAPETSLNLTLYGIFSEPDPKHGYAIIGEQNGEQKNYHVGDAVDRNVVLSEIRDDHVLLRRAGKYEILRFPKDEQPISVKATNTAVRSGIEALNKQSLLDNVRIIPVFTGNNRQLKGYRLLPQNNREAYSRMGIRPTDVVIAINGISLSNQNDAMRVIKELSSANEMQVQIERMGKVENLTLKLH